MIANLLNALTLSRILCAILIFLFLYLESYYLLALILFGVASFTDFLDGYVARKTNSESVLGEILDPIADKLLIVFVLIGLSINLDSFSIINEKRNPNFCTCSYSGGFHRVGCRVPFNSRFCICDF